MKHLKKFNENKINESFEDFEEYLNYEITSIQNIKHNGFKAEIEKADTIYYLVRIYKDDRSIFNINEIKADIMAMISYLTEEKNYDISYIYILKEENGINVRHQIELENLRELSGDIKLFAIEFKEN
jgi:hypothetical protein